MTVAVSQLERTLDAARGRDVLPEAEGIVLLSALGIGAPRHVALRYGDRCSASHLEAVGSDRVVVKVSAADIIHKSEVGGVTIVASNVADVNGAIEEMKRQFAGTPVDGFTIHEYVSHDHAFGNELFVGARWSPEFGPVVLFGAGGIHAEFMSQHMRPDTDMAVFSADPRMSEGVTDLIEQSAVGKLITKEHRGQLPRVHMAAVAEVVESVRQMASALMPHRIREFEINPLVISNGQLLALDVVVKLGDGASPVPPGRPLHKLKNLLEPRSIAIAGVSRRMNPGHVILNNLLRDGFGADNIFIVKPGAESIEGCRCFPGIAALPRRVDLFVLGVDASQVPASITAIVANEKAESVILITGGLEEKAGTAGLLDTMNDALSASRETDWQGPVVNGGNSLGVASKPGRYNTIFIPDYKLDMASGDGARLAVISQSGAFAIARQSKLRGINPRYTITVGNQMDVTVGDYLHYLKDDREIDTFSVYVEGFRPLDGVRFLEAAREITAGGRSVVLYRAGRTAEGARATASHTASIAGDFMVTRALAQDAGVIVAESIDDFEDLTKLCCFLGGKRVAGSRLGAVSNAGFECVAIADNLFGFELADLAGDTKAALARILREGRLDGVIDVNNPLDLTPMSGEAGFEAAVRAVLDDDGVDVGVVGCVPMTPALNTLDRSDHHGEDVGTEDALPARLGSVLAADEKACVVVIDGGQAYDAMAMHFEKRGIPVFRTADRALRVFDRYRRSRLRR